MRVYDGITAKQKGLKLQDKEQNVRRQLQNCNREKILKACKVAPSSKASVDHLETQEKENVSLSLAEQHRESPRE
ncbi:conserved hypothetical protein [Corynebacterium striatum]|nr:conserved hypothetical protein [Corynebacterium striatum]